MRRLIFRSAPFAASVAAYPWIRARSGSGFRVSDRPLSGARPTDEWYWAYAASSGRILRYQSVSDRPHRRIY